MLSKRFLLIAVLMICAAITTFSYLDIINSPASFVIITVLLGSNAWLAYLLLMPHAHGKTKLRRVTVGVALAIFGFAFTNKESGIWLLNKVDKNKYLLNSLGSILESKDNYALLAIIALSFLFLLLFAFNYFFQDKSVMKVHTDSFNENFPERDFNDRLKSFCNFLTNRIDHFDSEANWSDAHFTPIEAEVDTYNYRGKERRIANLLKAIKSNSKTKVFLVLGEPGSGKSVALRKICRDLIAEVNKTRKVPVYLNLKEWFLDKPWSRTSQPTPQQLYDFCVGSLKGSDIFADEFIDKYFKRLYENGHLFFIVDSFDEIPAVLDVDESSWLIDKLSEILYAFLGGAHDSRGVLASRYFRKPTNKFKAESVLNIRPFSDFRISDALNKYISIDKDVIKTIFNERTDLLPIASNPFSVGLIHSFLKDNSGRLPSSQGELFSSYINSRFASCGKLLQKKGLTERQLFLSAADIANYMFQKANFGLEVSLAELKGQFPLINIEDVTDVLVYARLGRLGYGEERRFSFVHRRFNEYFVIQKYLADPTLVDFEAIPRDSRFRDAMVLYCEVAPSENAKAIANFCWEEIKLIDEKKTKQLKRSIHCLRFLVEAYKLRTEELSSFRSELGDFIINIIKNHDKFSHPLMVKIAVEATGVLEQKHIERALTDCFKIRNWWINNTAIQSCKHLGAVSKELLDRVMFCVYRIDVETLIVQRRELLFSFSISDKFKPLKYFTWLRLADLCFLATTVLLLCAVYPMFILATTAIYLMGFILISQTDAVADDKKAIPFQGISPIDLLRSALLPVIVLVLIIPTTQAHGSEVPFIIEMSSFRRIMRTGSWMPAGNVFHDFVKSFVTVCLSAFIPWTAFYLTLKNVRKLFSKRGLDLLYSQSVALTVVAGCFVIIFSVSKYYEKFFNVLFNALFTYIIPSVFIFLFASEALFLLKDYHRYNKLLTKSFVTREQLAKGYKSLRSEFFRSKFLQRVHKTMNSPEGKWPDSFSLNGNSKSIIFLAQLDEKWLGLD